MAAGAKPAESATPAPDPEPPAPEGQAPARETPVVTPEIQEYLDASRGKGAPLPEAARTVFEAKFQRPFDDVRVHDDAGADDTARKIDAIAFTRGNDIYFRSAAYDPTSPEGKRLLAHELTHVIQQRPGLNRKVAPGLGGAVLRRKETPAPKKPGKKGPDGTVTGNTIEIAKLSVPKFKVGRSGTGPYKVRKGKRDDNPTKQASLWKSESKPKVADAVKTRVEQLKKSSSANQTGDPAFYLTLKGEEFYLIGTESTITTDSRVPVWDKKGGRRSFDIDHKREAQLGGEDKIDNLWLLDSSRNRSAGSTIRSNIESTLSDFLQLTAPDLGLTKVPSQTEVMDPNKKWVVQFKELVPSGADVKDAEYWEVTDFAEAKDGLLKRFEFADTKTVERLSGTPDQAGHLRPGLGRWRPIRQAHR